MTDVLWVVCYVSVLLGLSAYGAHRYLMLALYYRHKGQGPRPAGRFDELPTVTVQVPVYNERYVVERLIDAVCALDYPADKLEIQVLDDSTDDSVAIAAARVAEHRARGVNIVHLTRPNREGFKAGALAYGLERASGEFLAIFDADFVPGPELLRQTIDYFTDPGVGMIQTRWGHLNRDYSLLTKVQALFLDGHLLIEQTARSRSGRFINFNGTAGVWRRACIEQAGGWQHDTLTEDLDLSYRAQMRGWRFLFLPHVVAPAELPVEMNAFKTQQHRWAKGSVQTCKKLLPAIWRSAAPLRVKLEATVHLTSNFCYLLLFALCIMLFPGAQPELLNQLPGKFYWLDLPALLSGTIAIMAFYVCVLVELRPKWWRELWYIPALVALGTGMSINNGKAVIEAVFNHQTEFTRTPKYGIRRRNEAWRGKRYFALKTILPLLELLMGGYYTVLFVRAAARADWVSAFFLSLFVAGFLYVATVSMLQRFPWFSSDARATA